MNGDVLLFIGGVAVLYPIFAPWRKPFLLAWLALWFALWGGFFFLAQYETDHFTKGIISASALVGGVIAIFMVSSIGRLIVRWLVSTRSKTNA